MSNPDGHLERFEAALTPEAYNAAWRYACRLAQTREDAEDLLQESLVRALKSFKQLRDASCFKSWLLSIVRTGFLIHLRRRSTGIAAITGRLDGADAVIADLSTTTDADPLAGELAVALEQLPGPQRELVALFYFEGLSLNETAAVLGITPNAVTQRLYRARTALRSAMTTATSMAGTGLSHGGDR